MKPALDLTRYHWRQQHGDVTAYGTWWLASDSGPRPCLVLMPTNERSWRHAIPCVVPLNQAWVWSEIIGNAEHSARTAWEFAQALGLDAGSATQVIRVRSIIADHIGDLIRMPPMPANMRQETVLGEVKVRDREADRVVRHEELIERV